MAILVWAGRVRSPFEFIWKLCFFVMLAGLSNHLRALLIDGANAHPFLISLRDAAFTAVPMGALSLAAVARLGHVQRALEVAATTDQLTGLANRRAFLAEGEEGRRSVSDIVILLDVDHFKQVNDTYGHAKGDLCLKEVAHFLRRAVRPTDSVARYGGEEFAVVLRDIPMAQVVEVAQRVAKGRRFVLDDVELDVTFSMGVALWEDGLTLEDALRRADEVLYDAKTAGRARVSVYGQDPIPPLGMVEDRPVSAVS